MRTLRGLCTATLAGLGLAACSPPAPAAGAAERPAEPAAAPAQAAPGRIAFSVNVTLSKMAIDKMVKEGDQLRVSASYYGMAKSAGAGPADLTRVILGDEENTSAPSSHVVSFTGAYDAVGAKDIDDEPRVLINAISTDIDRGKYPMECTTFEGTLKEAAAFGDKGVQITCKAFGEP